MKICVVGSGISGLASAWTLAREGYEVTLFEEDKERHGGHAFTYHETGEKKQNPAVDLGFQVFNLTTYPYLVEFFRLLNVDHEPSDMSFSFSVDEGRLEWASNKLLLRGLFAQPGNALSPSFLHMVKETFRFGKIATEVLSGEEKWKSMTLGEYLDLRAFGKEFREHYLLPMTAAVWSVPNETMLDFPVIPLIRFWDNHHLLHPLGARPCWRVVKARSEQYVNAVISELRKNDSVKLISKKVTSVVRSKDNVVVTDADGQKYDFEHVVLACHSDQSLALLKEDSSEEDKRLLAKVRYQPNDVYLHNDTKQMPVARNAWASWNVLDQTKKNEGNRSVCVTYWLNNLQNLPEGSPLRLCTLNPIEPPPPDKVIAKFTLEHPVFDVPALEAQTEINTRQSCYENLNGRNVWFAGAWLGSGFHEDGIRSAVAVATGINGGRLPAWALSIGAPEKPALQLIRGPSPEVTNAQSFGLGLFRAVASRGIKKGLLRLVLPNGEEMQFGRVSKDEAVRLGEPVVTMTIKNLDMMMRCIRDSDVGLGEAYMEEMYDVDDIVGLFKVLILNQQSLEDSLTNSYFSGFFAVVGGILYKLGNFILNLQHLMRKNTVAGSRRNIEEHYDLGNDMYELFLDETMTYSAGIHRKEFGAPVDEGVELGLKESQHMKLDEIIRRADIQKGDHVLEIGCGWGSFAIRAAQTTGCNVTGITISTEQLKMAQERVKQLGLEDQVNLIICDYRKLGTEGSKYKAGSFDRVVSIEMIEAVGHEHLPEYFQVINRMLKPDGRACIQAISLKNSRYKQYMATSDFIRRHIFPGGHLPCMDAVHWATEDTDLALLENFDIGPDYAITLRKWRENFVEQRDRVMSLGYPESFFRKWIFYFAYCEAGFEEKYILDYHLVFQKDAAAHNKQVTRHRQDPNRLRFGSANVVIEPSGSVEKGSAKRDRVPMFPIISTALPVFLWLLSIFMTTSGAMRLVSTVAVLAVFVTSLLGSIFFKSYLAPPESVTSALKRTSWRIWWIDSLFATLVVVTVIVASLLEYSSYGSIQPKGNDELKRVFEMDYFLVVNMLLFSCFGRLAAGTAMSFTFWNVVPTFIHAVAFSVLMLFCLDTKIPDLAQVALVYGLLHGVGEVHSITRGWRKMMSLQGFSLGNNVNFKVACALDITALFATRFLPTFVYTLATWRNTLNVAQSASHVDTGIFTLSPNILILAIAILCCFDVYQLPTTLYELYLEKENGWNTDTLLQQKKFARSRAELIKTMSATSTTTGTEFVPSQRNDEDPVSSLYYGSVMHKRMKLEGVSPKENLFTYNVWMALIDLDEIKRGKAFAKQPWISIGSTWNIASWCRNDYYGADTGEDLDVCVRKLVNERLGMCLDGPVRLLTNLRCFGFGFNPVSIFYCFDDSERLKACMLEVSNTPWLAKRQYVFPVSDENPTYRWQKDFHVSPFMDVFHDYEWKVRSPGKTIKITAISYRRPVLASENEEWEHQTGDVKTVEYKQSENSNQKTFHVHLKLERQTSTLACILWQPFMTFSVVLWIHVQAFVVMIVKGCEFKQTPSNQEQAGIRDLLKHILIFTVASSWSLVLWITKPFRYAVGSRV